jgi:hypothetical protein
LEEKFTDQEYLKLWMYFQDKATSVKGAMFNTITWLIGFAAALLAFTFAKLTDFNLDNAAVSLPFLMVLTSSAGLVICLYAYFALGESAKHIKNNWRYADKCLNELKELENIVIPKRTQSRVVAIWKQLAIVVSLFLAAFIAILIWAITEWIKA